MYHCLYCQGLCFVYFAMMFMWTFVRFTLTFLLSTDIQGSKDSFSLSAPKSSHGICTQVS